jgi:polyvinyl alcohol dehydrogenase (cytochrome)
VTPALAQGEDELFDRQNHHANMRAGINSDNADQLRLAWKVTTQEPVSHAPLLHNGRVYFADWGGTAYAVDAETGEVIWKNKVENPKKWPWHGLAGTGEIANDTYYLASVEGNLFALDLETGEVKWKTRITDQKHGGTLAPPLYHDGLLYVGLESVEEPLSKMLPEMKLNFQGHVKAFDADTGELVWDLPLVESPHTGVPVWGASRSTPSWATCTSARVTTMWGSPRSYRTR